MFNVGDKIVYPMHGAGVIESIEEREILGMTQKYYVMKMPIGDIKVMVPTSNASEIGIREVVGREKAEEVFEVLDDQFTAMNANWNKRYRENMEKIKSGDIFEVADVVKNLARRDKSKGLSTGERKMLSNAKQILVSELVLVNEMDHNQVETMVNEKLNAITEYLS
jgi:CarD family transcriptional regulator